MGGGLSQLFPCFNPAGAVHRGEPEVIFTATEPLDETLGHSFCYVRSSNRFLSPTPSDRFLSPSHSLRFSPTHGGKPPLGGGGAPETTFKAISGASVSANTSTPRTVLQLENIYDDATTDCIGGGVKSSIVNGFESTSSFSSLPLQPLPRGGFNNINEPSGPLERTFFMSGPIERGALSGPLDSSAADGGSGSRVPFSAPLGGAYVKRKRRKGIPGIKKAFHRNFPRPWVVPVRNFVGGGGRGKESPAAGDGGGIESTGGENDVQWALGKAGEDRVHVVVSEEHGWLFVGIYDGFNGPDAPEFLMGNLYKAMYKELEGLFWDTEETLNVVHSQNSSTTTEDRNRNLSSTELPLNEPEPEVASSDRVKKVTFQSGEIAVRRRRLWEYLAEEDPEDGLDLSGSERFAFSVDDALSISKTETASNRRSMLLLSKLKHGLIKHKESKKLFDWKFGLDAKEEREVGNRIEERSSGTSGRTRKVGPVDHELVLRAMSRALEATELAYLDMTDKVMDKYPELALMGSCLLAVLMRDEDVYVMNLGDSRAIVAQFESQEVCSSMESKGLEESGSNVEGIVEESTDSGEKVGEVAVEKATNAENGAPAQPVRLMALQLSTDHSTSIAEVSTDMLLSSFIIRGCENGNIAEALFLCEMICFHCFEHS